LTLLTFAAQAANVALPDPGFEEGDAHWHTADKGMSKIVPEAARSGKLGLRVVDTSDRNGSDCHSDPLPATPGKTYALFFWARALANVGSVGVYLQFFDAAGHNLNTSDRNNENILVTPEGPAEWKALTLYGKAPQGAATLAVWIHAFDSAQGQADLDDFSAEELSDKEASRIRREGLLTSGQGFPPPAPARIAEIAAWLQPSPHGLGRPASDRKAWSRLAALPEAEGIVRKAVSLIGKPPPELPDALYLEFSSTGNRSDYERPYFLRTDQIDTLLLAECLEYKGRFLPALERAILAVCDERSWTMPAHDGNLTNFKGTQLTIDLGSSARGWLLASANDWIGDRLSPSVRERIRKEVQRRIFDPYLAAVRDGLIRGNWWIKGDNNWNAVCSAGVVCSALALLEKQETRAEILAAMEISVPCFIKGFTDDGYCSEGMGYWNYGFGHFVAMDLAVREATGGRLDLFQGEKLKRIAEYAQGYQIQTGCSPFFADGGGGPAQDVWALLRQIWPDAVPADAPAYPLLSGGHATVGLRAFGQEPPPAAKKAAGLPLRTWFGDAQVLITRSTGNRAPFGAAIKGGHNAEQHNHNDVGSYTVVLDGVEMMGDPGGEIYTRRTFSRERYTSKMLNSYGHPVPVVAGRLQPTGREFAAKILGKTFDDACDRLELDLTAAYPVSELTGLRRTYVHDRAARAIEITDDVRFASPQTFSTPLVTYRDVRRAENGTLYLHDKTRCVKVRIDAEGSPWHLDEERIDNPGKPSPRRMAVTFDKPVVSGRVRFRITPCALPDE
jgi:hypothetical protein